MPRNNVRCRAFTLLECLSAMLILGVSAMAITLAMTAGHQLGNEGIRHVRGLALAEAIADEIIRLPYADPDDGSTVVGPDAGESNRQTFDNVDDYDGYREAIGTVANLVGAARTAEYGDYARSVTTAPATLSFAGLSAPVEGLIVSVTVSDAKGQQWTIARFVPEPFE